ncbi:hypothetical protein [Modestobacter roseus]|uniref:HEPN domain-containing protein n=1 Tax=Modestobacter roseus TaxID=1181884 RepID=A0A562IVP5_9ACTN|nr:hypothetical protein [Modestobacter roseus]MQA35980.1 hypothetical protein [Modestobacter roseus]TWH75027.1 hypothetical protein JD78_03577 [Modestobacter roseus]
MLLNRADALMVAADVLLEEREHSSANSAAAAVAVIAGIAAADALCGVTLGRRSRGEDHRQAIELLRQATPDDPGPVAALTRLLDVKDQAHYGTNLVKREDAVAAVRRAHGLIAAAKAARAR